jgi:hypothetical protein
VDLVEIGVGLGMVDIGLEELGPVVVEEADIVGWYNFLVVMRHLAQGGTQSTESSLNRTSMKKGKKIKNRMDQSGKKLKND